MSSSSPSWLWTTPDSVRAAFALSTRASGTMKPIDPGSSTSVCDGSRGGRDGVRARSERQLAARPPYRRRLRQRRRDGRQQPRGVVDHVPGHPEAERELLEVRVRSCPDASSASVPGANAIRGCGLRQVAEDGRGAGRALPADRAEHHRRQVLRLVEHDVAEARGPLQQVARPRRSGRRRAATSERCADPSPGSAQLISACSSGVRTPSAAAARKSGSPSSRITSRLASTAGQIAAESCLTGRDRATDACTRSSGESPASSILTRTACASRCGSMARPAPYRTPRVRSSCDDLVDQVGRRPASAGRRTARPAPRSPAGPSTRAPARGRAPSGHRP